MFSLETHHGVSDLFFYVPDFGYFYGEDGDFECWDGQYNMQETLKSEYELTI